MWTVVSVSIDRFIHYKWITRLLLTCRDNRTLKYPGHLTMPSVSRGLFRWLFHPAATLEDFADRLNPVWTVGLLLILASVLSWRHAYMGSISCWCPSSFTTHMVTYSEMECWNKDVTYSVMSANNISDDIRLSTNYARWLPLLFCFQALLFKLPNIVLHVCHGYSGISFDKIAGLTNDYENLNIQEREILARQIARYVYRWCRQCGDCLPWRFLTLLWLLVKVLYLVNVIVQLNHFDAHFSPYDTIYSQY